jgi:hypothetical protein
VCPDLLSRGGIRLFTHASDLILRAVWGFLLTSVEVIVFAFDRFIGCQKKRSAPDDRRAGFWILGERSDIPTGRWRTFLAVADEMGSFRIRRKSGPRGHNTLFRPRVNQVLTHCAGRLNRQEWISHRRQNRALSGLQFGTRNSKKHQTVQPVQMTAIGSKMGEPGSSMS